MKTGKGSILWTLVAIVAVVCVALLVLKGFRTVRFESQAKEFVRLRDIARNGDVAAMREALAKGADVNMVPPDDGSRGYTRWTFLHEAARSGQPDMVRFLIESGADVHAEAIPGGDTPLERTLQGLADGIITQSGRWNEMSETNALEQYRAVVKMLVEAGALDRRFLGGTGLKNLVSEAAWFGDEDILRFILSTGAMPEERGRGLEAVANTGREDLIKLLHPEDIPRQGLDRALYAAASCRQVRMLDLLLNLGANVDNRESGRQDTPLHAAARLGSLDVIECLVNHGAKLDLRNEDGKLPLDVALDERTRAFLQAKASPS